MNMKWKFVLVGIIWYFQAHTILTQIFTDQRFQFSMTVFIVIMMAKLTLDIICCYNPGVVFVSGPEYQIPLSIVLGLLKQQSTGRHFDPLGYNIPIPSQLVITLTT
jgi:hypothetical protein